MNTNHTGEHSANRAPGGLIHPGGRAKISTVTPEESNALHFPPLSQEALHGRDDMEKVGTFGLRISKQGPNVKENLNPETLRLKG